MVRLRPSRPTARALSRRSDSALRSSRNGESAGCAFAIWRNVPSLRSRLPLSSRGQGYVQPASNCSKRSSFERAAVEHAVVAIDVGDDQRVLQVRPSVRAGGQGEARRSERPRAPCAAAASCSDRATGRAASRCAAAWPAVTVPARRRPRCSSRGSLRRSSSDQGRRAGPDRACVAFRPRPCDRGRNGSGRRAGSSPASGPPLVATRNSANRSSTRGRHRPAERQMATQLGADE